MGPKPDISGALRLVEVVDGEQTIRYAKARVAGVSGFPGRISRDAARAKLAKMSFFPHQNPRSLPPSTPELFGCHPETLFESSSYVYIGQSLYALAL